VVETTYKDVLPIIESARGLEQVHAALRACRASCAWPLAASTWRWIWASTATPDGAENELLYFRSQLVLASRLAGLDAPVDGVSTAIDDCADRLQADAERARRLGFGAKLCIHPKQVAAVQAEFTARRRAA
jgi:citrate lyase subunit beta/citryl-CoA lyase